MLSLIFSGIQSCGFTPKQKGCQCYYCFKAKLRPVSKVVFRDTHWCLLLPYKNRAVHPIPSQRHLPPNSVPSDLRCFSPQLSRCDWPRSNFPPLSLWVCDMFIFGLLSAPLMPGLQTWHITPKYISCISREQTSSSTTVPLLWYVILPQWLRPSLMWSSSHNLQFSF